ncbi:MAG TPA: gluconate 2-dehydrogenase subunit 3 family protein [Ramlibacter sp.]|nr:gluconate 2-dehydrogenase subunit 3 family protein [Ramlibacter sp.]
MNRPFPTAGSDADLTSAQLETLGALLDMIVPATPDGRMPGAGEMTAILCHIAAARTTLPALRDHLDKLDREAMARCGSAFAAVDEVSRVSLLEQTRASNPLWLHQLALETVTCYYQQDRVLEALGMEARPPYPKGYRVEPGDLSLLNPVIARGKIYRDIS